MKIARFFVLSVIFASALILAGIAPDMKASQTTGSTSETLIQSVSPQTISLTPGGPAVTVTMTGQALGNILAVQVIQQGKLAEGFIITLKPTSATTRAVEIKAAATAVPGDYQLRIILKAQKRDLPSSMAAIIVKAGATSKRSAQKAQSPAASPSAQTASAAAAASPSALLPKDKRVIRSSGFNSIASSVFNGAYFDAMSCGGKDSERKTTANVPNAYFKQEPLDRMEYKFTDGEKERSKGKRRYTYRRVEIRACVDGWRLSLKGASIEGGKFRVLLSFPQIQAIKTRVMEEDTEWVAYSKCWDWSDQFADEYIQDFRFSGGLDIYLTPVVENGNLTCHVADLRWAFYEPLTGWIGPGHFALPEVEEPKIIHYKDKMLEVIRQRVTAMFSDQAVRAKLSAALTQSVKSGDFAARTIIGVSGKGEEIEVTFQK
jgi:hypothetical protein